jgi:hypothetical protein
VPLLPHGRRRPEHQENGPDNGPQAAHDVRKIDAACLDANTHLARSRLRFRASLTAVRAMKLPPGRDQVLEMIRVVLTDAAYDAIASTLPKGAARWPMQRDRGQCFIQVEAAVIHSMRAMRRPGESYSQAILRLVELETGDLNHTSPTRRRP